MGTKSRLETLKGGDYSGYLGVNGRIIFRNIFNYVGDNVIYHYI